MKLNVDELMITNVSCYKVTYIKNGCVITFSIDDFRYEMYTSEGENGLVSPRNIAHLDPINDCNYCDKDTYFCHELGDHQEKLFHRLIQFPSIRLEWLYTDHV